METRNEKYYDASELTSALPVHPGGLIGDEIKERGISQKDFARGIGMQASQLSAIIHGVRNVTPAVAAKLESGFVNIPATFWLRLQEKYNIDLQKARLNTSRLVTGYMPTHEMSVTALADSGAELGSRIRLNIAIPISDKEVFNLLAARFGWEVLK
ncbi:MAG: HigA family addiction module antidote protein [Bacteroidales bacterium]|nr:HigA family addiction module antidote protein [Bacteroidales bacterium]